MLIRARCGVIFPRSATPTCQFSGFSGRFFPDSLQYNPDWQINRFHASETGQYRAVWLEDRTWPGPIHCSGNYRSYFQGTPGLHRTLNPDMLIRARYGVIFPRPDTPTGQLSGFSGRFFSDSLQYNPDWQTNHLHASETGQYRAVWVEVRTGPGPIHCSGNYRSYFHGTPGLHYTFNPDMPIRAHCGVIFRRSATPTCQFSGFSGQFFLDSLQNSPDWQINRFHASETGQYRAVWLEVRLPGGLLMEPAGRRSPNTGKPVPASSRFCEMHPTLKCPGISHTRRIPVQIHIPDCYSARPIPSYVVYWYVKGASETQGKRSPDKKRETIAQHVVSRQNPG